MDWVFREINERILLSPSESRYFVTPPPPQSNLESSGLNLNNKVSPSILLIIVLLAVIFFVSGIFHLFVRFLLRLSNRNPDELDDVTALQGQLQQLFDLHDAGVDQSLIDTLPVFNYKSIIGVKTHPFDCAVCLCEFESEDKLRLLPQCSHAFHMECIDTWLLSHSTCPICRAILVSDFSTSSPIVHVLESASESSRDILPERDSLFSIPRENSQSGLDEIDHSPNTIEVKEDENLCSDAKVVAVKLGKFINVDSESGGGKQQGMSESENKNVDGRRCFSMGSFEYVMDENSLLKVPMKKQSIKINKPSLFPGHRHTMSECAGDSRREFQGFDANKIISNSRVDGHVIGRSKIESFSISKIWLRGKNEKPNLAAEGSRRAFSFRLPIHQSVVAPAELKKPKNGGGNTENGKWGENGEENIHTSSSLASQANPPSFGRRSILWLKGKQNKVVHSSFPNNL